MIIGIDIDGTITNLEEWFETNGIDIFISKHHLPTTIAFLLYAIFSQPRPNVIEKLNELSKKHTLVGISARKYSTEKNLKGKISKFLVEYWCKKYKIPFHNFVLCDEDIKVNVIVQLGIELMIEDNPKIIATCMNKNIPVITMNNTYYPDGTINDWKEIKL